MNQTLIKAIDSYGGKDTWANAKQLTAEFSAGGLAFLLKHRPRFKRAKITMDIFRPHSRITPIGSKPNVTGVLDGLDVYLENEKGEVIQTREKARRYFPGGRRYFCWDDLDMAYFANYAMWNYLTLPALLMRDDILWNEVESGMLEATFPDWIPTHNRYQRYRFDKDSGLLIQHDYTAEVISRMAKAAHIVLNHSESNGITYTSHRRVTPRATKGKAMRGPRLIEITIHDFRLD